VAACYGLSVLHWGNGLRFRMAMVRRWGDSEKESQTAKANGQDEEARGTETKDGLRVLLFFLVEG